MLSLDCFTFINGCLRYEEKDRYSKEQLLNHTYLMDPNLETKAFTTREKQHQIKLEILKMNPKLTEYKSFLTSENATYLNIRQPDAFDMLYK